MATEKKTTKDSKKNAAKKKSELITISMTIGEVIQKFPDSVGILLEEGIHCVGCGAAFWETLEEGLTGHGKTKTEMDAILKKLNKAASEFKIDPESITVTDSAAKELKKLMKEEKKEGHGLRIEIVSDGCSGARYNLDFDKKNREKDEVIEIKGLKLFVDQKSFAQLKGSRLDFIVTPAGSGFKIDNPNIHHHSSCGCN